ncbi:MAG: hypothetical protein IKY66_02320 [Bacteroidales bacterium]|nr:hypothetical protein [Bacteroidales bacterium]
MNSNSFIGQIDLMALIAAQYTVVDGQECIVIPVNANPAIYMSQTRSGQPKAMLDVFIRETSNNQYGNTHFVKANVGKANRERFGISKDELGKYSPIIGNIRPYDTPAPQKKVETSVDEDDDLPPDTFKGF